MADATLDILRQDAILSRIKGVAGGQRIVWSAKDIVRISDHIKSMPERIIRDAPPTTVRKFLPDTAAVVHRKLAEAGVSVNRKMQSDDLNFLFLVSSASIDLAGDSVLPGGIDTGDFNRNPAVLNAHDSSAPPIAISTAPWVSGDTLLAIAKFPAPGISVESDQIAAAIRASLVKGASIGFIPVDWAFSKNPARPFGVDFYKTKLLEWSPCAVPCNPDCLILGAVSGGKSASHSSRNIPIDGIPNEDTSDWQCSGSATMPVDSTDDPFDPTAAKIALLANCSPGGTISDEVREYFFAVDVSKPFDAKSYDFAYCRVTNSGIVASKVGWRKSFANLEKSNMSGMLVSDARALVDRLELRLGDVKTAARRREARALTAKAKLLCASIGDDDRTPMTRDQRMAEARNFHRLAMERGK